MKHRLSLWLALVACLLSLCLLASCGEQDASADDENAAEKNAITAVTLSGDTITVKVAMTQSFLSSYKANEVHLLELPHHRNTVGDLAGALPAATAAPSGTITLTLPAYDGTRSRLASAFVLATKDASGSYMPLTATVSLQNPQAAAPAGNGKKPTASSIKGLSAADPAEAIRLGVAHTVVDVSINQLLADGWSEDAVSYVAGGTTAYLNGEALEALDETVSLYTDAGVRVYLRFLLSATERTDACTKAELYFPGTESSKSDHLAVNMGSATAAATMEGFLNFMADRYASPEDDTLAVTDFIIGLDVNDPVRHNSAGQITTDAYITNYEKLVHVAHITLLSHNANGRVYISLDDRRLVGAGESGWDVAGFLAAFREEANLRGNYNWHIATRLHAANSTVWMENQAEVNYFTIRNLSYLTDMLTGESYATSAGDTRSLIISGYAVPAVLRDETPTDAKATEQAASYAFAYMTALRDGHVDALIYDCYVDATATSGGGDLCGLWSRNENGTPKEKRPICKIFSEIDTSNAATMSSQLTALIGSAYTKLDSALAGTTAPVTAVSGSSSVTEAGTLPGKASTLLSFTDGTYAGMEALAGVTYMELRRPDATEDRIALHTRFDRETVMSPMALTVPVSASSMLGAKSLILDMALLERGEGAAKTNCTVTLRLSRTAKGDAAAVVYESTLSGMDNTRRNALFDITAFTEHLAAEDAVTLTVYIDNPTGLSYDLDLSGVYVTDSTGKPADPDSDGSSGSAWTVVLVIVAIAAAGVGVFFFIRRRRYP